MAVKLKSKSGFWKVDLARPFPDPRGDHLYKPGENTVVNEELLDAMIAADVVDNASPA